MSKTVIRSICGASYRRAAVLSLQTACFGGALASLPDCTPDAGAVEEVGVEEEAQAQELGGMFLVNNLSGRCIDGAGAPAVDNGARLQLWDCESSGLGPGNTVTDQKWEMTGDGFIRNTLSGRCIDVTGAPGIDNGARLQLWDCEYSGLGPGFTVTDQKWEITGEGFIRNKLSGRCIDVAGAPGIDNGAVLQLWDCEFSGLGPGFTATDQKWHWQ